MIDINEQLIKARNESKTRFLERIIKPFDIPLSPYMQEFISEVGVLATGLGRNDVSHELFNMVHNDSIQHMKSFKPSLLNKLNITKSVNNLVNPGNKGVDNSDITHIISSFIYIGYLIGTDMPAEELQKHVLVEQVELGIV